MNIVRPVREKYKNKLPAITHIDGTARIQTVNKKHSRLFWELINEFGKLTKFPVLLNTSFNIMGEPIVENPSQAINCFKKTDLDYLIIGNFVVRNDKKNKKIKVEILVDTNKILNWLNILTKHRELKTLISNLSKKNNITSKA